jgi:putative hemolysin
MPAALRTTLVKSCEGVLDSLALQTSKSAYDVRLAATVNERRAAYRLRFIIFNLELNEGLESAYQDGFDTDPFDEVCDHLIVESTRTGEIVGTYRLQTGMSAARNKGYYSAGEFDFAPYENIRGQVLELGRACVHRDHRSFEVINLLWRGIADYALQHQSRYLVGCSSLTSQDEAEGASMYRYLHPYLASEELRTVPLPGFEVSLDRHLERAVKPPKLLRAYLAVGAKICGPPAIDREFKTIDFLTLLDLENLNPSARLRYLGF